MRLYTKNRLLLIIVLFGYCSFSQQYPVKNLNLDNGLLSNTVRSIFKDSRGLTWVGTQGGVSVLANNTVINNYTKKDGLAGNFCWDITEDVNNSMWFGSYNAGITMYDGTNFKIFNKSSGLVDDRIRKLFYYNNHIFVGTDGGLSVINIKTNKIKSFTKTYENEGYNASKIQIQAIFEYDDKIYVNGFRAGLFEVNYLSNELSLELIRDYEHIISSKPIDSKLYTGHDGYFTQTPIDNYFSPNKQVIQVQSGSVFWDFEKANNNIYAAAWGVRADNGGVYQLVNDNLQLVNEKLGISSKNIVDLYYDGDYNYLYVASLDRGLFIVDVTRNSKQYAVKDTNETPSQIIDYIKINNHDEVFLLENELQIFKHNESVKCFNKADLLKFIDVHSSKYQTLNLGHSIELNRQPIKSFMLQSLKRVSNKVWLSTNTGLFEINSNGILLNYYPIQNENFTIHYNNDLIVPIPYSYSVIFKNCDYDNPKVFHPDKIQNLKNVEQLISTSNETFLLDRSNGLYMYEDNKVSKIWEKRDLKTMCFSNDTLYVANNSGTVFKALTQPEFKLIDSITNQSFRGETVNHIQSHRGKQFLATDKGLNIIDRHKRNKLIDESIGLTSRNINFLKKYDDTLIVGTGKTYSKLALADFSDLKPHENELLINNIKVNYRDYITDYKWGFVTTNELTLPYDENIISIAFNTIGYQYSDKLNYSYNIRGLDEYWSKPTKESSLVIPYLPQGNFTIQIKVIDDSTGISKVFQCLDVHIKPPFWKTIWFIISICILVTVIIFVYLKIRTKQIKKNEAEKSELHKRIVDTKLEALRSQMNPHFTFNAMNSIQNFIVDSDIESAMLYLSEFSKLIRTTLEYSTLSKISISDEIAYLKNYISLENMRFGNKVEVNFNIDEGIDVDETEIVPMTLQPFIENVFEHAFTTESVQPKLDITFKLNTPTLLEIIVTDNGSGYKDNKTIKLSQSRGVSLVVERLKLVQQLNESVKINSSLKGTKVVITHKLS